MPLFLLKLAPLFLKLGKVAVPFLKTNWKFLVPALAFIMLIFVLHLKNNTIDSQAIIIVKYTLWLGDSKRANATNQVTISTLRGANKSLAQAVIVSEEVRADAYAAAQDRERRAAVALDDTKRTLRELENETPTCAEITRIDIGAACPLSVELLRQAAAGTFD